MTFIQNEDKYIIVQSNIPVGSSICVRLLPITSEMNNYYLELNSVINTS